MSRRSVDNPSLERWRALDAAHVLVAIAEYAKQDAAYVPIRSPSSTRWHANVGDHEFEVLCTGVRFLDTRENKGGGGAIDLVMHFCDTDFKGAAKILRSKGL